MSAIAQAAGDPATLCRILNGGSNSFTVTVRAPDHGVRFTSVAAVRKERVRVPTFSIVTTCKGRLEHLQRSLPSFAAQSGAEVVVVDYDCPDGTGIGLQRTFPTRSSSVW